MSGSIPGTAPKGASKDRATFGIAPATFSKSDARAYFSYQMGVGGTYSDKVAVLNYGSTPLALTVYATDLSNADDGSVVAGLPDAAFHDAGGWINLPRKSQTVTVPATNSKTGVGRVVLPFRVIVPSDAPPGDHGAALIAVLSTLGKNAAGQNVRLNQRLASRIYLRVAGPLHPSMAVEKLRVTYSGDTNPIGKGRATVSYVVRNTGNVRLGAGQSVTVNGLLGAKIKVAAPAIPLLFPGSQEPVTVKISGVLPTILERAHVLVTPALFSDQTPEPVPVALSAQSFHAVPWTAIAIGLLVIVLIVVIVRRRRRPAAPPGSGRHKTGPRGPSGPSGPLGMPRPVAKTDPKVTTR